MLLLLKAQKLQLPQQSCWFQWERRSGPDQRSRTGLRQPQQVARRRRASPALGWSCLAAGSAQKPYVVFGDTGV